ncbi:MAG TPA: S4 domain-containing protein [Armatimonadota bacterium]|nr:S4 domain-containing protein [Armatimonadota bacterium]
MPTKTITADELAAGVRLAALLSDSGLVKSRGEAKRLIQQGGLRLWDERITDMDRALTADDFRELEGERAAVVRAGKGKVLKVALQ